MSAFAIVPYAIGWTVAPVDELAGRLADDETLDEALTNAGLESGTGPVLPGLVERVRALNVTGDLAAFRRTAG